MVEIHRYSIELYLKEYAKKAIIFYEKLTNDCMSEKGKGGGIYAQNKTGRAGIQDV